MDQSLDNKYYMLTTQQSSVGVGGNTIWYFDSKSEAVNEIIDYFAIARLAFEWLEDDHPEVLEDFDEAMEALEEQGDKVPDSIIEEIDLCYNDRNYVSIFGKGKEVLLRIITELKIEIRDRCFDEEDVDFEDWFSELLKKIESDNLSIIEDVENLNECLYCS